MKSLGYSKKKRRTRAVKTPQQREDSLPWDIPLNFDPTFLPTSLYKSAFASPSTSSSRILASNVQKLLEPYYDFTKSKTKNNSSSFFNNEQPVESTRIETIGCGSACLSSSPILRPHLSGARETSNSCPIITLPEGINASQKNDLASISKPLPPIGVFWDIENCSVPRLRSALVTVQRIREKFFTGHLEAEFVVVCDIRKESPIIIQELNDAQVSVVHVAGNSKNAADDKLRQSMRRFADISCSNPLNSSWPHPATVVLISGDINFATDLSDLRYRKRLYVILLHNRQTPDAIKICAHEQYEFHSLLVDLPFRYGYKDCTYSENNLSIPLPLKGGLQRVDLLVTDLPVCDNANSRNFVRNRLRKLSENCGGKVLSVGGQWALIRFPNSDSALRASKRMNGEDVLGYKIRVVYHPHSQMDLGGSTSFQTPLANEEFAHDNLKTVKPNNGLWKPNWKRNIPASADMFRQAASHSRLRNQSGEMNKYSLASTTAQSNSSTPNDSSRDGSPNVLKPQNSIPPKTPVSSMHLLNNSSQYPSMANTLGNVGASSGFAFQQNLYSNYKFGGGDVRQESQIPPQHQQQQQQTENAVGPRLFSAGMLNSDGIHPLAPNNQHNLGIHLESSLNKIVSGTNSMGGNGILMPHPTALTPMSNSPVLFENNLGGVMPGGPGMLVNPGYFFQNRNHFEGGNSNADLFDLNVTNIDPSLGDWKLIRSTLSSAFSEHVNVRGIWVNTNSSDGSVSAIVRLNNKEDAHYAVAQLHRRKIGNKRIFISFDQGGAIDHDTMKKEVASLLQDVPNHTLPLFKFREMFEKRYKRSVSSSDLYRMKDVVAISESSGSTNGSVTPSSGRNISLTADWKTKDGKGLDLYCKLHPPKTRGLSEKSRMGWAEKEAEVMLPNVVIEIKTLRTKVHALLQDHDGGFPLISFMDCYESKFGPLEKATEGRGVPLEHLISCVQGVMIVYGDNGMKRVQWHEKKENDHHHHHSANQPLATQLAQFGRELIDLLKTLPKCTLPFARLIPSYHAHFGRQCRVADYGHFSLSALLQTLPHIIQMMGAAQNRVLTLSHRAQVKRFATDLLRVLKSQGGPKKQIRIDDFPEAFANVFPQRQFQPEDYGLCFFSDLISELVEHSTLIALVKDEEGNSMLAVPKREQTPQEIHKTRIFASEVVELLRHSTRCELEFSKFVPYYHHHFEKQCKVSDYGFSKLAELFDAISDTVMIINPNPNECATEDKIIRLTPKEQTKVIGEQVCAIIEKRKEDGLETQVNEIEELFLEEHGFHLRPDLCGVDSLSELVNKALETYVKVENGILIAVDRVQIEDICQKAEAILQQAVDYKMEMEEFLNTLNGKCENVIVDETSMEKDMSHVLIISTNEEGKRTVALSPLRVFAYEMVTLLESHGGYLALSMLETMYFEKFGKPMRPAQLGYPTAVPMLQAIPDVLSIKGKPRTRRMVVLNSAKAGLESSISDESSGSTYGKQTPRSGSAQYWRGRDSRPNSASSSGRYPKRVNEWKSLPHRRSNPPQQPLFSPLASPVFQPRSSEGNNVFSFDRANPLSPPVFDVWMQESVAPGSPPLSPPVVWTCHPIFYPSSPPPTGPGNILMPSPFGAATWSPPSVNTNCMSQGQAATAPPAPQTMLGSEFLFGQNRLSAQFEGLTVDTGNEA